MVTKVCRAGLGWPDIPAVGISLERWYSCAQPCTLSKGRRDCETVSESTPYLEIVDDFNGLAVAVATD